MLQYTLTVIGEGLLWHPLPKCRSCLLCVLLNRLSKLKLTISNCIAVTLHEHARIRACSKYFEILCLTRQEAILGAERSNNTVDTNSSNTEVLHNMQQGHKAIHNDDNSQHAAKLQIRLAFSHTPLSHGHAPAKICSPAIMITTTQTTATRNKATPRSFDKV